MYGRLILGALLFLFPTMAHADVDPKRPNVVFILADDLGWADLGCYGSSFYETPNLDRLAREGMRFTDAYAASSVCSPTRASLLTGQYPARTGITSHIGLPQPGAWKKNTRLLPATYSMYLSPDAVTLAEAVKPAGYQTAFVGKWHLGADAEHGPERQGFDVNIAASGKGSPPSYFSPYKLPNLSDAEPGEYLTDRLTDETLKQIDQNKDRPFLIYLSHYAVHTPLQAKPELVAKYEAKAASLQQTGPEFATDSGVSVRQVQRHAVYAAMLESLDASVGRILEKLETLGLDDNTIVIFTSDNGGLSTSEGRPTSNLPLRTGKGWHFEGGVREPLIVKWPGVTRAGSVSNGQVTSPDFLPTILQMLEVPRPAGQTLDGVSIVPLLKGEALPERPLFWHYPHYSNQGGGPGGSVRLGDFKLIEWYEDMSVRLYNLKDDVGEQHDLAQERPEQAASMRRMLHAWRAEIGAVMPTPNPNFRAPDNASNGNAANDKATNDRAEPANAPADEDEASPPATAPSRTAPASSTRPASGPRPETPTAFTYTPALPREPGVTRRDPSDVIRVDGTYYLWYSKVTKGPQVPDYPSGYSADVWYATSPDGRQWTEQGQAIGKGAAGAWDERGVFTPNILMFGGKYYLYYTAVAAGHDNAVPTPTHIGVCVSDSPDGPWQKFAGNPVLSPSDDPAQFDSARVDDAAFLVRDGTIWFYYKGRMKGKGAGDTKMGVAIADGPTGPFVKHGKPLHAGHEVLVWPQGKGVGSLATAAGPRMAYYAADGLTFEAVNAIERAPAAPGAWRDDAFQNNVEGAGLSWGIGHVSRGGDLHLVRFDREASPND